MQENEFDVFISYSRKDSDLANRIFDALEAEGVHCFIDREGISGGADFPTVLSEAIMGAKVLLLVASENSYASEFTQKELTFAVSNKGSRFIFPVIVDGSTLPKNLEFLLSNINWRTLSSHYTIEKELVADVKKKLADPQAGMTIKEREKNTVKTMMIVFFSIVAVGLGVAGYMYWSNEKQAQERLNLAAQDNEHCVAWIARGESCVKKAESLLAENGDESFDEIVASLNEAKLYLARTDSIGKAYDADPERRGTNPLSSRSLSNRYDSCKGKVDGLWQGMTQDWKDKAEMNYEDYLSFGDSYSRSVALKYVEQALVLSPENPDLLDKKKVLGDK